GLNFIRIEQPWAHKDIVERGTLQENRKRPICLDESIRSFEDARKAIQLGSCKSINLKIDRVVGLTDTRRIHHDCIHSDIDFWCGGMLEAGVGRAHNIALTTLKGFTMPGDTAGSSSYWEKDIITPEVVVKDGEITVPSSPGIGYEIDEEALEKFTVDEQIFQF